MYTRRVQGSRRRDALSRFFAFVLLGAFAFAGVGALSGSPDRTGFTISPDQAPDPEKPSQAVNLRSNPEPSPSSSPVPEPNITPPKRDPAPTGDSRTALSSKTGEHPDRLVPWAPDSPAGRYGLWVLTPAVVAIVFSLLIRQVVPALVLGLLCGAYMMRPCLPQDDPLRKGNATVDGFRLATERYVVGSILDPDNDHGKLKIIMFTLCIGFTVGVLGRNGGTSGMVKLVTGESTSPRRGTVTAALGGLVVFFDDYANAMIIGPTMRSVFDRLRVSRAKLAYIVDSTAAPVASLALIGTWIGAEISYIQDGLNSLDASAIPGFLLGTDGSPIGGLQVFLYSLPYRFYALLAIAMVFLVCLTGRDFGPMRTAQQRAVDGTQDLPYDTVSTAPSPASPCWWLGLIPILALIGITLGVLAATGMTGGTTQVGSGPGDVVESALNTRWWSRAAAVFEASDPYASIFYGAIISAFLAVILTPFARTVPLRDAVESGMEGMARTFPAVMILILAWSLAGILQRLMLGEVVSAKLSSMNFPIQWMSLAVFISAAVISFSTGTSWGTMAILCPLVIVTSVKLISRTPDLTIDNAWIQFYGAVGAVLAGAVFGDHCSPISDTTVLSSIASGCRHEEHVWTQFPYALVTAVASLGLGDVLCSAYGYPWYIGLAAGLVFLLLVVLILGRPPRIPPAPPSPQDELRVARRLFTSGIPGTTGTGTLPGAPPSSTVG